MFWRFTIQNLTATLVGCVITVSFLLDFQGEEEQHLTRKKACIKQVAVALFLGQWL